ncbi:MAG: zinc ribbon domain-containing protein [Clostridia bacterium]|nr:zinc ribbon domain-containing protein [Clostridia bacterium]
MFCKNCGAKMNDNDDFCSMCGEKKTSASLLEAAGDLVDLPLENVNGEAESIPEESIIQEPVHNPQQQSMQNIGQVPKSNTQQVPVANIPQGGKAKPAAKPKKSGKKVALFAMLTILLILLIGGLTFYFMSFPLEVDYSSDRSVETLTGTVEDLRISIESNQPIKNVYHAVAPKDSSNLDEYSVIESSGIYSREIELSELKVPVGESTLYICVTTLFGGKDFYEIEVTFDIGEVKAPQIDKIVEYEEGKKLVSNELIIVAKANSDQEDIE